MIKQKGFSLVEMMIVVVIVGVLAAIAVPSYNEAVKKSRRSDAYDSLLAIQNMQEKWRANNSTYGTLSGVGFSGTTSVDGYYTMAVTRVTASAATTYIAKATAVSGKSQASDTGCTELKITVNPANPRGLKEPAACWSN